MAKKSAADATETIARELHEIHQVYDSAPDISMKDAEGFLDLVAGSLFPQLASHKATSEKDLKVLLETIREAAISLVQRAMPDSETSSVSEIVDNFLGQLPPF